MKYRSSVPSNLYRNDGVQRKFDQTDLVKKRGIVKLTVIIILLFFITGAAIYAYSRQVSVNKHSHSLKSKSRKSSSTGQSAAATPIQSVNNCDGNTLPQMVVVSISQRHLWACNADHQVYDSAVVTGMENLPADLTPTGTYKIYSKQTNLFLNGSDSTGSWHDYVYYWMPFLSNQYGIYGFHDATWRSPDAFGNISPYSSNASHGCVETPLSTAKWLFNWASIGASVKVES